MRRLEVASGRMTEGMRENAFADVEFDDNRYSGIVTSDSVLFWPSDYSTTLRERRVCTAVALAIGDTDVSTITRDSFDLWRIGWSTLVQVPLASVESSNLLVRGWCPTVRMCTMFNYSFATGPRGFRDRDEPTFPQRDVGHANFK